MSTHFNRNTATQQLFKLNVISLTDRLKNLEQYISRVAGIAFQSAKPSSQQLTLEEISDNNQSLLQDVYAIIQMKHKIPQFNSILAIISRMIAEYEEIASHYQNLHQEYRQIVSKFSVNKEIFHQFKFLFQLTHKYFIKYTHCLPLIVSEPL